MKKIIALLAIITMSLSSISAHALSMVQTNQFGAVETAILTDCGSKDGSESVVCVINLVVNILSVGVGILGVVAISVVGVQYLTAGDSEEKVRTAKRRLFEIVIGLAAYAVIYALLQWLLPGFG